MKTFSPPAIYVISLIFSKLILIFSLNRSLSIHRSFLFSVY